MLIPPQLIKQEVNRNVSRETNQWRSPLIQAFTSLSRDAMKARADFENAPCPTARDSVLNAIGQLKGYVACRDALWVGICADNSVNQARGLIHKLTVLISEQSD